MACLAMHIAIAKEYLKNNKKENAEDFYFGAISPDIADDRVASHFGTKMEIKTVKDMLDSKVDIKKAATDLDLSKSENRALFLHLVTDFLFYNFVYSEKLEQHSPAEIKAMMYADYDFVTKFILEKYDIEIPNEVSHIVQAKEGSLESMFFDAPQIVSMIDGISKLDLSKTKEAVLKNHNEFMANFFEGMQTHKQKI